jgi:hypothetical protein
VAANRADVPSAADDDLLVERAPVADADNGFRDLEAAAEALQVREEVWSPVSEMLLGRAWDASMVDRLLADNREAIELAERASGAPWFASPPFRDIDDPLPDFLRWQQLARLLALRAIREARAGDAEASITTAITDLRLARLVLADRESVLIHAMIALSIASIGTDAIMTALPRLEPTAAQSRNWSSRLAEHHVATNSWREMWAAEYRVTRQLWIKAADAIFDRPIEEGGWSVFDLVWKIVPDSYLYQPNRSLTLHADVIRSFRSVAGGSCASMERVTDPLAETGRVQYLVRPNGVGRLLAAISTPNFYRFELRRCHLETRIEAARAQIALRAHELETGRLPETLADLAPRYLDPLPRDYFVGELLGYDRARREVRSVGSDLEPGPTCDDGSTMLEPCFPLADEPSAPGEHAGLR